MISNSPEGTIPIFEWRLLHDGVGKTPNVRTNASTWVYKNDLWVSCGAGSGQGKSSEIWRFDMSIKSWSRVPVIGEAPSSRDGQSGTYIGEGKFVIFGGQGFAEPNKKLGKESEGMKTQTHWKRDVLNDLWVFDCESSKWTPIYPNGLSFPMGRRGHSAIFISKTNRSHANGLGLDDMHDHSDCHITKFHAMNNPLKPLPSASSTSSEGDLAVPENTLLVYGGAGIELSKYTEQLYNDVWLYSFESNTWRRYETKGVEPTPVTNHRVERVGDNMIVVGGITNVKTLVPLVTTPEVANVSDFMVFNLLTSTWTFVPLYDNFGKVIRVNMHGFTLVPDTTIWTEIVNTPGHHHGAAKERLTAPLESQKLFLYGGKHIVDGKQASTTKSAKLRHDFDEPVLILNVKESTLTPLSVRDGCSPDIRYAQLGFCGMSIEQVQEIAQYNAVESKKERNLPTKHLPSMPYSGSNRSLSNPFLPKEIPAEETVLLIFGGCNVESGGYCDPALFSLVKKNMPISMANQNSSSSGLPLPESNRLSSPDLCMDSIGSWSPGRSNSFGLNSSFADDRQFEQFSGSIWTNVQNKQNLSNGTKNAMPVQVIREPSNWDEMKLSLTPSHSQRIFDAAIKRIPSRQKTSSGDMLRGTHGEVPSRSSQKLISPPLLMLNDVDFAYRSVSSHNQGSPRSPWHLPSMDLDGTRATTASTRFFTGALGRSNNDRASTAPANMTRITAGFSSTARGLTPLSDVDPDVLAEEKRKRIYMIKSKLKPVVRSQTKIHARESYQKLFPKPYG